ncbi:MAG: hypothetical protein ABL986_04700 [Vicinamibacterales bacterium]
MNDLENPANRLLAKLGPSNPDGTPDGPVAPPEAVNALPAPSDALLHQPDVPSVSPAGGHRDGPADLAHLIGEPGTLPATWCKQCAAEVLPVGKGRCPRCNTFLRLNFAARKHPVNKMRRQQILDKLVAEYTPQTTMLTATCEHLAGILEQLETMKPGSTDHQRLVQLGQLLGAALEEAKPARPTSSLPGLASMPVPALELARDLLKRVKAGEALSEFDLGRLDVLRGAMRNELRLTPDEPESPVYLSETGATIVEPASTSQPISEPSPSPPTPEPTCQYSRQPSARCAE